MGLPGARQRKRAPAFGRRALASYANKPASGEKQQHQKCSGIETRNKAPKDDLDVIAIPAMPTGSMVPGEGIKASSSSAAKEKAVLAAAQEEVNGRKRKRRGSRAPGDAEAKDQVAATAPSVAKPSDTDARLPTPKQKPGESARTFSRRVDEWTKQKLKGVQMKANTEYKRQKKRDLAKGKKAKAKARKKGAKEEQDGLFKKGDKAAFGDTVERPPILSSDARKSLSKLKAKAAANGALKAKEGTASEFENYAAKVRDAYAAIKAKRFAVGGRG